MGPANKIKNMIDKEKKSTNITDEKFLSEYIKLINDQITQMETQKKKMELEITAIKLNRKHILSIIRKLKKKND